MFNKIEEVLNDIKEGKMIILVDDEDRENEGDIIIAAEKCTPDVVNFMACHAKGLICMPMLGERLDQLDIPVMVLENTTITRPLLPYRLTIILPAPGFQPMKGQQPSKL
jgi:3,4-dihydroxy 2-butanone 4-phosphate synthase/GTP cyclohydrolase II